MLAKEIIHHPKAWDVSLLANYMVSRELQYGEVVLNACLMNSQLLLHHELLLDVNVQCGFTDWIPQCSLKV